MCTSEAVQHISCVSCLCRLCGVFARVRYGRSVEAILLGCRCFSDEGGTKCYACTMCLLYLLLLSKPPPSRLCPGSTSTGLYTVIYHLYPLCTSYRRGFVFLGHVKAWSRPTRWRNLRHNNELCTYLPAATSAACGVCSTCLVLLLFVQVPYAGHGYVGDRNRIIGGMLVRETDRGLVISRPCSVNEAVN